MAESGELGGAVVLRQVAVQVWVWAVDRREAAPSSKSARPTSVRIVLSSAPKGWIGFPHLVMEPSTAE
jgi:hypothetical protein